MASTEQIRKWFHSGVVLNHADRGTTGYHPHCDHDHPKVGFPNEGGGTFAEPVHPVAFEAFTAYVAVMRHHDETMPGAGGVNACRNIGTGNMPSLHAYLCAIDLPPNSRKTSAFITSIKAIRTNSGAQVFRTLRGDRMHDQINCSPTALRSGIDWTTVVGDGESDDMETIKAIQKQCNAGGFRGVNGQPLTVDGILGPNTQHAMNALAVAASVPGEKGDKGDKGSDGLRGPKGAQGIEGDPGPTGIAGIQGVKGDDGKPSSLTISGDQTLP